MKSIRKLNIMINKIRTTAAKAKTEAENAEA